MNTASSLPPITFNSLQRRRSAVHHHPSLQQHTHNSNTILPQTISIPKQQPPQFQQCGLRSENTTSTSRFSLNQVISSYNSKTDLNSNAFEKPKLRSEYSRSSNSLCMNSSADEHYGKALTSSSVNVDKGSSISLARPNVITFNFQVCCTSIFVFFPFLIAEHQFPQVTLIQSQTFIVYSL